MSIQKLKKVTVIGHNSLKNSFLDYLHNEDILQIENVTDLDIFDNLLKEDSIHDRGLEDILKQIKFLIDLFEKFKEKEGLFSGLFGSKVELTPAEFKEIINNFDVRQLYEKYSEIYSKINNLHVQINNFLVRQDRLKQWVDLEIPLEEFGTTACTISTLGYIKSEYFYDFAEELEGLKFVELERISSESNNIYLSLIYHKTLSPQVSQIFNSYDFKVVNFPEEKGKVHHRLFELSELIETSNTQIEELESRLKEGVEYLSKLYVVYDFFEVKLERLKGEENLGLTAKTFTMVGWLPEKNLELFEQICSSDEFKLLDIEISDPATDDRPPILFDNPELVKPFEMITDLYGRPDYFEIDPSFFFLPFFTLFFGVCLTDGGYGLILLLVLGSLFIIPGIRKRMKNIPALLAILFLSSIPTIIMGVLTGGFFGIQFKGNINKLFIFNPLDEANPDKGINFMKFSIYLGIVHIYIGIITNFIKHWRLGNRKEAIHKNVPWLIIIPALSLLVAKVLNAKISPLLMNISLGTFVLGVFWVVLFDSYDHPSFIKRIMKGAYNAFFGITGLFGDVLSYLRLFAIGLSTGVLALVINILAGTIKQIPVVGFVFMVIFLIIGHLLNMGINALGGFVHTLRLQFVEFFQKFYDGTGRPFETFGPKFKYVNINESPDND